MARDAVRHVAAQAGADVLHLRAHDIAYVVGRYAGQDVTRTPGDVAMLGFRAAEHSGRIPRPPRTAAKEGEGEEEAGTAETILNLMLQNAKEVGAAGGGGGGRHARSMTDFLSNAGIRGKQDDLWEELKINMALEELVHLAETAADSEEQKQKQRPLIVHVHDYNALRMDETGAAVLDKIGKVVDELWLSGRRIALLGTCSTRDAPKAYVKALKELEATERVTHLRNRSSYRRGKGEEKEDDEVASWEDKVTKSWMKQANRAENVENLVRMLCSMNEPASASYLGSTLGLTKEQDDGQHFPENWSTAVLPMREIYRTATTMIGILDEGAGIDELFTRECFDKAVKKMAEVDALNKQFASSSSSQAEEPRAGDYDVDDDDDHTSSKRATGAAPKTVTTPVGPITVHNKHEERLLTGLVNARDIRTTFDDIHAPRATIESIKMLTTLSLIRPEEFSYGVLAHDRIPGCLLYGPPGTGKTLLAKAVAKQSGAHMIEVSAASINMMYVGESEKMVRALFSLARKKQPMVVFIDEADALLGARHGSSSSGGGGRGGDSRRDTLNQFLREWDGLDTGTSQKIFIMVATNRPFDLDEAVLRRLPRKLLIDLPVEKDRAAILRIHLRGEKLDEVDMIDEIARRTPLYSGSDLKNVCVAAAMAAVRETLDAEISASTSTSTSLQTQDKGGEVGKKTRTRVLSRRHFETALAEIGASSAEDTDTLAAIRKFDDRYGDGKSRNRKKRSGGMGFGVVPEPVDSEGARVRSSI
ncbi:P-loop containing nucleoside triphosphate hydrolase protein [Xylariaceae sp. FL0594]|nr:P-loop containing nucleoside triphosphate hydrolase protein [Xylariaceae sp. FL0594]